MGTKTLRDSMRYVYIIVSEKRIPKHGDENIGLIMIVSWFNLVKKESPYMGTIQFPVLYQFLVDDSYLHVAML